MFSGFSSQEKLPKGKLRSFTEPINPPKDQSMLWYCKITEGDSDKINLYGLFSIVNLKKKPTTFPHLARKPVSVSVVFRVSVTSFFFVIVRASSLVSYIIFAVIFGDMLSLMNILFNRTMESQGTS